MPNINIMILLVILTFVTLLSIIIFIIKNKFKNKNTVNSFNTRNHNQAMKLPALWFLVPQ